MLASDQDSLCYGSVCSGIEAVTLAWQPLGLRAAWFSEIDPFACALLAHRYPAVANLGDMTCIAPDVSRGTVVAPDILVGGTPCQSFSVAGQRNGLDDPRGALTLKYVELANAIDKVRSKAGQPSCVAVWENVPGVLSDQDNAFGCFLGVHHVHCDLQGVRGRTLVVSMDPKGQPHGGCWMPNISAWPNDASACSLSQVLEATSIPPRYFLSAKACAGILRRARKSGKTLPALLRKALERQAKAVRRKSSHAHPNR